MVDVTQADRDAAASGYYAWIGPNPRILEKMVDGNADDHSIVQAFARHREAALTTAQAEIEALKAERDKLAGIVQGWHYLAVGPDEMGDYYTHKQLVKLSEPYASPALKALSEPMP